MTNKIQTQYQEGLQIIKSLNNGTLTGSLKYALASGVYTITLPVIASIQKGLEKISLQ